MPFVPVDQPADGGYTDAELEALEHQPASEPDATEDHADDPGSDVTDPAE